MKEGTTPGLNKVLSCRQTRHIISSWRFPHFSLEGTFQINTLISVKISPKWPLQFWIGPGEIVLLNEKSTQVSMIVRKQKEAGFCLGKAQCSQRRAWENCCSGSGPKASRHPAIIREQTKSPDSRQTKINKVHRDTKTRVRKHPYQVLDVYPSQILSK